MVHRPASLRVKPQSNLKTPPKSIQTRAKSVGNPWAGLNAKKGCSNKLQVITSPNWLLPHCWCIQLGFVLRDALRSTFWRRCRLTEKLRQVLSALNLETTKREEKTWGGGYYRKESGKIGLHHIVPRCSRIYIYIYLCYIYIYIYDIWYICRVCVDIDIGDPCVYTHMYISIYIYTCIHVYMFTCIYVYVYIHIYIYICIHTYIPTYLHTYIPTYIHTSMHACIHTDTQTHRHTHIYIYKQINN